MMRRLLLVPVLAGGCLGASTQAGWAQAIVAPSGRTLFNRATLVRSFVEVQDLSLRAADGSSEEVRRYVTPLALVYGFYPQWIVIAVQPYLITNVTRRQGSQVNHEDRNGLADLQLLLQYDGLYSRDAPGGLTRLAGVFGLQLPSGARRFSPGALQYTGALVFEKVTQLKYALTADFQYTVATENDEGMKLGNRAHFDAVPAYFVISREEPSPNAGWFRKAIHCAFRQGAYLMVEFNGAWQGQARRGDTRLVNTGGTTLFVSPGIQYFASRRLMLELSVSIPAVKALNGLQPEPDAKLLFGFRWLF